MTLKSTGPSPAPAWAHLERKLFDSLLQLAMGSPRVVYHGGLCHAPIGHFNPVARRPELPGDVTALV